jgi:hypothetical protein
MKSIQFVITILFITIASKAQVVNNDTIKKNSSIVPYDTIAKMPIELEEVYITNRYTIKSAEERKRYLILQRRVLKVYPYAKAASERLTSLNEGMDALKTDREKRKYFKIVENYLTNEFEDQLKKLSRKDGQILIKLIHRQTGSTAFELIKDLKSGWKAFWSNNTARLFDLNLKTKYEPAVVSEDFIIESILYRSFSDGRLERQESKVQMNYAELAKIWRAKLAQMKAENNENK